LQPVEKLVAFATPGSADTTFPLTVENEVFYVRISDFGAELSQNYSVSLSRAIYTLARTQWSENEQERLRWVIFQRAVTEMLPFASLAFVPGDEIKFQENSVVSRVVTFKQLMSQSELQQKSTWGRAGPELVLAIQHGFSYLPLSSGQASFVRMAAQLALNVTEGSLVLIDEPETHLHPKFVSQFMAMLDSILGATKSVAVIATHSPFVVREVSKDQVHVLHVNSEKTIEVFRPRLKTFGADVGTISASVFGDDLGTDAADKIVESILADPERYTNWEKNLFTELSVETVLYIRRRLREHGGKHE
jgi:ABC-type Mn2+/Zn2+ transport system ATPase subunit